MSKAKGLPIDESWKLHDPFWAKSFLKQQESNMSKTVDITDDIIQLWALQRSDDAGWLARLLVARQEEQRKIIDALERFTAWEAEILLAFRDDKLETTLENAFKKAALAIGEVNKGASA